MSDEAKLCTVLAGLAAAAWVVVILFLVGASYSWTDERFQQPSREQGASWQR